MNNKTIFSILFIIFSLLGNSLFSSAKAILSIEITLMKNVTGCYGDKNAYIKTIAIGGTPDYTFTIDNWLTSQTSADFLDLDVGTYTIKVRDALNAEAEVSIEIFQPSEFLLSGSKVNVTGCFGETNGRISLLGSGGIEPYYFSINEGANFSEQGVFNELPMGLYKIIGKDKNNCQMAFDIPINEPDQMTITTVWTVDVTPCYDIRNGTATISSSGGTGLHSYSIDGNNFQDANYFETIAAGAFTAYAKDENGCSTERNFSINQPPQLVLEAIIPTDLSCNNSVDGVIEIQANGGTAPLFFSLNQVDYSSSNLFTNLNAGTYSAKVKDNKGCSILQEITLTEEDPILIAENHSNEDCNNGSSAWINLNVSGGAGSYSYSINSGLDYQTENVFQNLKADNYTVLVQDIENCSKSINIEITEPSALVFDSIIYNHLRCNGDSDAQISIYSHGGTGTLFYSVNSGSNFQNSNVFENQTAGYYPILVQDENSCSISASATLNEPIFNLTYNKVEVDCYNSATGSIGFNTYGSNPPFHFSMDNGNSFQEVTMFINLAAGVYNYIVKDQIACTKIGVVEIIQPEQLLMNEDVNSGCITGEGVSITMNPSGGTSPYYYSIDDGQNYQNQNLFSALSIGTYLLKVLDTNNCSVLKTTIIENPNLITTTSETTDLACFNDLSGAIKLSLTGGVLPYQFSINNGLDFQTDSVFNSLSAGDYPVVIKDKNNCETNLNITITQADELVLTIENIEHIIGCSGDATGSFLIASTGGTGAVLYSLDNGEYQNSAAYQNLIAKEYLLNAKDANQCVSSLTISINQPDFLSIDQVLKQDVVDCFGYNSGSINILASGGSLPLLYSINRGENYYTNSLFENLSAGSYTISVRDASQCLATSSSFIIEPNELIVDFVKEDISCFGEIDGEIEINATGGSGVLQYSINNGVNYSSNFSFSSLEKGQYILRCKDDNNCTTNSITTNIIEPSNLIFSSLNKTDLQCDRINGGIISVEAIGGTGTILYSIDNSAGQIYGDFLGLSSGEHTITIEDANFCSTSKTINLTQSMSNCIEIPTAFTPNDDGINDTWEIQHLALYPQAWVQIFDRFGNTITRYKAGETGWNGNFNYKKMPMGSYWYKVQLSQDSEVMNGYFSLIR